MLWQEKCSGAASFSEPVKNCSFLGAQVNGKLSSWGQRDRAGKSGDQKHLQIIVMVESLVRCGRVVQQPLVTM